jgi:hypothetical protein
MWIASAMLMGRGDGKGVIVVKAHSRTRRSGRGSGTRMIRFRQLGAKFEEF